MPENSNDPVGSINISPGQSDAGNNQEPEIAINAPLAIDKKNLQENDEPVANKDPHRRKMPSRSSGKKRWLFFTFLFFFLFYCLAGFAVLPYALQTILPEMLAEKINRPVTVGSARFNPFTLNLALSNAIIGPDLSKTDDQVDPVFSVGSMETNISWSSLLRLRLTCSQLSVDSFFLHLVRGHDKSYNVSDILSTRITKGVPQPALPFSYLISNISFTNSRILFDDLPSNKKHKIEQIELSLPLLFQNNSIADKPKTIPVGQSEYINPKFSALVNNSPIEITGKTTTDGDVFTTRLKLHLEKIDLPAYFAYLPDPPNVLLDTGTADIVMDMRLVSEPQKDLLIEVETVGHLSNVSLRDSYNHLSTIPAATISGTFLPISSSFHFKEISLKEPEFHFGKLPEGNWSFLAWDSKKTKDSKKIKATVTIDKLTADKGKVTFIDQHIDGGFSETIKDVNLTLTSEKGKKTEGTRFSFSGKMSKNSTFLSKGNLSLSPFNIAGDITLNNLNVQSLSSYLPLQENIHIKQAVAEKITSGYTFTFDDEKQKHGFSFTNTKARLNNVTLSSLDQNWLMMPKVDVACDTFTPGNKTLHGVVVTTDTPEIYLKWDEQNNFLSAAPKLLSTSQKAKQSSWDISISTLLFNDSIVHVTDESLVHPAQYTMSNTNISVKDLPSKSGNKGQFTASSEDFAGAKMRLSGSVTLAPFSARLTTKLTNYSLGNLAEHFGNWQAADDVGGTLNASGTLTLPGFNFTGTGEVHNFSAGQFNKNLIRSKKATGKITSLTLAPLDLSLSHLNLTSPELHWVVPAQGQAEVTQLFQRNETEKPTAKRRLTINKATLTDATLHFTDQRVSPHFTTVITFHGEATDLVSAAGNRTKIHFSSTDDSAMAAEISGELGLYDTALYADLAATFHNQAISDFSPYLEALLGYKMDTGIFSFSTKYNQEKGKIISQNSFSVTNFQLGEPLALPTPLPLTVALLSEEQGTVNLRLPVTGTTSDPSYSFAGSLGRVLRNLVLKTTVSPYSHLAGSFPEIENTADYLLFQPGSAALSKQSKHSLTILGNILNHRPMLTLSIKGFAGLDADKEMLLAKKREQSKQLELRLEQKKSKELSNAYGNEEISPTASPAGLSGVQQKITQAKVSKSELLQLARKREKAVIKFLQDEMDIASHRLSQDTSSSLVPGNAPGREGNRADFRFQAITQK